MPFTLPPYRHPDFSTREFSVAPRVRFDRAVKDGVAPEDYHATSIFPEYFHLSSGQWVLPRESRMDCVAVLANDGSIEIKEFRNIRWRRGGLRQAREREDGTCTPGPLLHGLPAKFAFRAEHRETSFHDTTVTTCWTERQHYFVVRPGPPNPDMRERLAGLVGPCARALAGNALATHDVRHASLHGPARIL